MAGTSVRPRTHGTTGVGASGGYLREHLVEGGFLDAVAMPPAVPAHPAFEEFLALWTKLLSEEDDGRTTIVVEGERDRLSVRRLGWHGPVLAVHGGRTLSKTAHEIARTGAKAIVLTDWDTEGGHLAHRLREFLEAEHRPLDLTFRQRLARVLRGELVHVEGLYGWARRQAEAEGRSIEALLDDAAGAGALTG
jgi:5S rRNA maturation endonuclease (ribonuclease M5)